MIEHIPTGHKEIEFSATRPTGESDELDKFPLRAPSAVENAVAKYSGANGFTPREQTVISLVCRGLKNDAIAQLLGLSTPTVRFHLRNIHRKTSTADKVELVLAIWRTQGIPEGDPLVRSAAGQANLLMHRDNEVL